MKKTVCAFIGCGGMAGAHRDSLVKLWQAGCRDFDIAACCDIVKERAEKFADVFAGILGHKPRVYDDVEVMLKNEKELDSVAIFTPAAACPGKLPSGPGRTLDQLGDQEGHDRPTAHAALDGYR